MINSYEWDWDHAIFVNDTISDELVNSLTPQILRLKQRNPKVITVGIDSTGGNVDAATRLLSLLKSPGVTGEIATVVTIATNKAFSAAATLLALGDYAVALPSARIHYHDVRFGTYPDLTSTKALHAARSLQRENDRLALRLAHSVVERLTWIFIDLRTTFAERKKEFPDLVSRVNELGLIDLTIEGSPTLDLGGFLCAQYKETSANGDAVINTALQKLKSWRELNLAYEEFSRSNKPAEDSAALFRDDNPMLAVINSSVPLEQRFTWASRKELRADLVFLFLLLFKSAIADPQLRMTEETIADLMVEYAFFEEIRRKEHLDKIVDLVLKDDYVLFDDLVSRKLKDAATQEEREKLWKMVFPQIQAYWVYVVLLCRTLFDGEHPISLEDALFLGLIDEIPGRKFPEPKRYVRAGRIAQERKAAQEATAPLRKWLRPSRRR